MSAFQLTCLTIALTCTLSRVAEHAPTTHLFLKPSISPTSMPNYNNWTTSNMLYDPQVLPRACERMAVGYHHTNDTIWLWGGYCDDSPKQQQLVSIKNNVVTDHGAAFFTMPIAEYVYYQSYTQIKNTLWIIDHNAFTVFNMETLKVQYSYKNIIIPKSNARLCCLTSLVNDNISYLFVLGYSKPPVIFNITGNHWLNNVPEMIVTREDFPCVTHSQRVFAIGGDSVTGGQQLSTIEVLNVGDFTTLQDQKWNFLAGNLSFPVHSHRAVVYKNEIIVLSGWLQFTGLLNIINIIDTTTGAVRDGGHLNYAVIDSAAVVTDDTIYLIGGRTYPATNLWQQHSLNTENPTVIPSSYPSVSQTTNTLFFSKDEETAFLPYTTFNSMVLTTSKDKFMGISVYLAYFVATIAFIIIICSVICVFVCIKRRGAQTTVDQEMSIQNALCVIIVIGHYIDDHSIHITKSVDLEKTYLSDLPVDQDIENLKKLFNILKYKTIPNEFKLIWTEVEIINYFKHEIGKELFDCDKKLKYDGLIVCISCHGIENKIITSDYKTIEKTVLHRIISIQHPETREIPRIFIFDSCEGSSERIYLRPSIISTEEYLLCSTQVNTTLLNDETRILTPKNDVAKGLKLEDISQGNEWTHRTKNPDYKLSIINAANTGYQAKCSEDKGSYLIHAFTAKMGENILNKTYQSLRELFVEIQNELHDEGKQQITHSFNNGMGDLIFLKNNEINDGDNYSQQGKENVLKGRSSFILSPSTRQSNILLNTVDECSNSNETDNLLEDADEMLNIDCNNSNDNNAHVNVEIEMNCLVVQNSTAL
eukprot:61224_1